jgi:hypothetical protein
MLENGMLAACVDELVLAAGLELLLLALLLLLLLELLPPQAASVTAIATVAALVEDQRLTVMFPSGAMRGRIGAWRDVLVDRRI